MNSFQLFCFYLFLVLHAVESSNTGGTIKLSQKEIDALKSGDPLVTNLVFDQVNLIFQKGLNNSGQAYVDIENDDIDASTSIPNFILPNSRCSRVYYAKNIRVTGTFSDTKLTTGFYVSDGKLNFFLEADLDASMTLNTDIEVDFGFRLLGKCVKKVAHKTVHADIIATGKIRMRAVISGDLSVKSSDSGQYSVTFGLGFTITVEPYNWVVDQTSVSRCSIKVLGEIKLGSYCGYVKDQVQKKFQGYLDKYSEIQAPLIVEKLEKAVGKMTGDQVEFPVEIVEKDYESDNEIYEEFDADNWEIIYMALGLRYLPEPSSAFWVEWGTEQSVH